MPLSGGEHALPKFTAIYFMSTLEEEKIWKYFAISSPLVSQLTSGMLSEKNI